MSDEENKDANEKSYGMANAGALDRHMRMDSGRSSPNTTYSIAPLAKLSETDSHTGLSVPRKKPSIAPRMVGAPVTAALHFFMPPATRGTATDIPSGML